ncbi:uncharacterized protein LOC144030146 isoform X1 [Festucalex cinctus]
MQQQFTTGPVDDTWKHIKHFGTVTWLNVFPPSPSPCNLDAPPDARKANALIAVRCVTILPRTVGQSRLQQQLGGEDDQHPAVQLTTVSPAFVLLHLLLLLPHRPSRK